MGGNKGKRLPRMRFIMTMREELKNYFSFMVTGVRIIGYLKGYPEEGQRYVVARKLNGGVWIGPPRSFYKTAALARQDGNLLKEKLNKLMDKGRYKRLSHG